MSVALYFIVVAVFSVIFTREVIAPASGANCDKRWQFYAAALSLAQVAAALGAGVLFNDFFRAHALVGLPASLPAPVTGLISFVVASLVAYWWHRATHRFDILWRVFHQLHHSPSRIESLTSFYLHPFDTVAAALINALCAYLIFGLDATAAAWGLLYAALDNLFIHMDLRTPRWLGVLVQRPEMHRVHHKHNFHAQNYGMPIWDLLFGTFENPKDRVVECGFRPEAEYRVKEMLLLKDVEG
jgi:sterol desaturase/sphingolipid hydroxylase (fatty acid hydroxylase superfamily)